MLRRRRSKRPEVYLAVLVLIALHWTQTEASPLNKINQQVGKEETANTDSFQPGIIVIEENKNASAEADTLYQADDPASGLDIFNQMQKTLQCGSKQMKFSAYGSGVGYFKLKHNPPLPLSQVPPACGYTIEGYPHRLVLHVPYDGCNIDIEGGYYNLPMLWKGYTVKLKCPKPYTPTLPPWWTGYPWAPPPTTTPAPQDPVYPPFPWLPYPWPPTTTPAPQDPVYPPFHSLPPWFYWFWRHYYPHVHPWLLWYYLYMHHQSPSTDPADPSQNILQHLHNHIPHKHFPPYHMYPYPSTDPAAPPPQMPPNIHLPGYDPHQPFPPHSHPPFGMFPKQPPMQKD